MKHISLSACLLVAAALCAPDSRADQRVGVVRISDTDRGERLISNPVQLVSFDDDDDTCLPPPPVCKVPVVPDCKAPLPPGCTAPQTVPVAPAAPQCDLKPGACCPSPGAACCNDGQCKSVYRCHKFDARGRCRKCDDNCDRRCDRDDDDDCRKGWKKWQRWIQKHGRDCQTGVCGNGDCPNGVCGDGHARYGDCENGRCKRGFFGRMFGKGHCGDGVCGCDPCQCENCQCGSGNGCGRRHSWDLLGLFGHRNGACGTGWGSGHHGLQLNGRGGHGLFGGDCGFDTYRADCERTRFQRWAHRKHCERNALARIAYRRDGFGWGTYHIAYPVNHRHFDPRDGQVYAAQGWGIPMAVPVAPNVEHTYNYSWGVPASRLSPMSYPGYRVPPVGHAFAGAEQVIVQP